MPVLAGWGGRVQIAVWPLIRWNTLGASPGRPQILKANKWNLDFTLELADLTGTQGCQMTPQRESPSKVNTKYAIPQVADITITVDAFYDTTPHSLNAAGDQQFWFMSGQGHQLTPGTVLRLWLIPVKPTAQTLLGITLDRKWYFNQVLITQATMNAEAKGIIRCSFTAKNISPDYEATNI